jgi:anti-sigma B factor antagonist
MALSMKTNKIDGVVVVYLSGVIYFGEESSALRQRVKELLENSRQIVLDMGGVSRIDSGGLGTLVALFASARKGSAEVKLARLGGHPEEVLQITKLFTLFEIFKTAEEAAASFKRAASAT